jgi:hypothetical protein
MATYDQRDVVRKHEVVDLGATNVDRRSWPWAINSPVVGN